MAINFPSSPLVGDLYTFNGKTWQWDGSYWVFVSSTNMLSSATTVGGGVSIISGISNSVLYLKSLTGGVTDNGNTISISGGTSSGTTSSSFTGGTVTGATNFTNGLTANTFSATTVLADNILKTVYRLPSSVALPVSTTTTAATVNIPRTSVFVGQTIKVEGIFVGQQPTAANKTITNFWNNGANGQSANVATTSNSSSFGFIARVTSGGVTFSRQSIYTASNQGSASYSDVGGNILINVVINPSTSAATLEHLVVTIY